MMRRTTACGGPTALLLAPGRVLGFLDVYDKPAHRCAVNHKGGIQKARKLADEITGAWVV